MNWFEVDRAGLRQLVAGRPEVFLLYALTQNALDEEGVSAISDNAVSRGYWPGVRTAPPIPASN